jgi:hypothetical protein
MATKHRSLQPTGTAAAPPGGPPAPNLAVPPASARFDELLDTLKHAYDDAQRETIALKMQRDEYEAKSMPPLLLFLLLAH